MESATSTSQSSNQTNSETSWQDYFHTQRSHDLFIQIDPEFILDRFNLAGLNLVTQNFSLSLSVITDTLEVEVQNWELVDKQARHLYGMIHARYLTTTAGLSQVGERYRRKEFGVCPRYLCNNHPVLPIGLSDLAGVGSVKQFCPNCQDIYMVHKKYGQIDGCYFTTTMAHLVLLVYPSLVPDRNLKRYEPRVFGFKVHDVANRHRKQDEIKKELEKRLMDRKQLLGIEE